MADERLRTSPEEIVATFMFGGQYQLPQAEALARLHEEGRDILSMTPEEVLNDPEYRDALLKAYRAVHPERASADDEIAASKIEVQLGNVIPWARSLLRVRE